VQGPTGVQGPPGPQGIAWAGAWDAGATYATGQAVSFGGSSFLAIAASSGQQPDLNPSQWAELAQKGDVGPSGATVLAGEVSGDASATVVGAAVSANVPGGIVRRDGSGNFSAGIISADLSGNASTATSSASFTGPLSGVVTGTQGATTITGGALTGAMLATGQVVKSLNGLHDAVTLTGGGATSISTGASSITISTNAVTGITAGNGIAVTGTTTPTVSVSYGGDGAATTVSRSDHDHLGQGWTCTGTDCKTLSLFTNDTGVNSAGLLAKVNDPGGQGTGIWGITASTSNQSSGVFGQATSSAAGAAAKGVWGVAAGPAGIAVYGQASNGAKAAQFDGNVSVNGTLSKSSGTFKIDHPLDPEHKYLYHSFVESPDMKNLYDGVAVLDQNGEAEVTLPEWFEALNQDFRYQLTAVGRRMPDLYVAEEIQQNRFRIAGGVVGGKVSWQVTGTRHDAWANAHRVQVEETKPANEQGTYLFPAGFGADESRGLSAAVSGSSRGAAPALRR
jgi:hypothetical protein